MVEERGFTLIELLIVILIVGILAAIAIPSFLGQRERADGARSKAIVRTAQSAMETWKADSGQTYVGATAAVLRSIEPTLPTTGLANPSSLSATGYVITYTTTAPAVSWTVTRAAATGRITRTCSPTARRGKGGCSAAGTW